MSTKRSLLTRNKTSAEPVTVRSGVKPLVLRSGLLALLALALSASGAEALGAPPVYRIDRVTDGDTVVLSNGKRVRLVQIDTPEVFFGVECYGRAASRRTKTLLPAGTRVRLQVEPATDRVDQYGRLLRYVVRATMGSTPMSVSSLSVPRHRTSMTIAGARTRIFSRLEPSGRGRRSSACGAPVLVRPITPTRESPRGDSSSSADPCASQVRLRWRHDRCLP